MIEFQTENQLTRAASITQTRVKEQDRTVELSFASSARVDRGLWIEELEVSPGAVRLDRLRKAGAVICDHDSRDIVGTVVTVWLDKDKVRALVRFGNSDRATDVFQDVKDGIRTSVSFGYVIHKFEETDTPDVLRAIDWEPLEISFTAIPADVSVGVGRSFDYSRPKPVERRNIMDIKEIQEKHKDEENRVSEILAIGTHHNRAEMAIQAVRNKTPLDQFRQTVMNSYETILVDNPGSIDGNIGIYGRDLSSYSVLKAIHAMANPNDRQAQEAASMEREVSREAARVMGKSAQGFVIPNEVLKRDFTYSASSGTGSNMVATDHLGNSFVDILRAKTLALQLATVLSGLRDNLAIPKQLTGAVGSFVAENVAVSEQTQTVGQVELSPKTIGCFTNISRRMIKQSSPDAEMFVMGDLAGAVGCGIDIAAINGAGGDGPVGILNTTGLDVSVVGGTNGAAAALSHVVGLESVVSTANADFGKLAYLTNTKVRSVLKQTEVSTGTGKFVWSGRNPKDGSGELNGYSAFVSNNVPANLTKGDGENLSALIFGNWADLIIGMWGGLEIIADPYSRATDGTVRVTALQDVDIAVRRVESFAAMVDIVTG